MSSLALYSQDPKVMCMLRRW